jgi:hypothetical protein
LTGGERTGPIGDPSAKEVCMKKKQLTLNRTAALMATAARDGLMEMG